MKRFSVSKARSVARTDWNCNLSRLSCARRMLQHRSRGITLHLSAAFNRKVFQMHCTKSNCKSRRPNQNPMDYYVLVLLEALLLLAVLHIYALRQWVRSVCRSQKKLRNTAINTTYDTTKRIIFVRVGVSSSRSSSSSITSSSSSSSSISSSSSSSSGNNSSGNNSSVVLLIIV